MHGFFYWLINCAFYTYQQSYKIIYIIIDNIISYNIIDKIMFKLNKNFFFLLGVERYFLLNWLRKTSESHY